MHLIGCFFSVEIIVISNFLLI